MLSTFEFASHVIGIMIDRDLTDAILEDVTNEIQEKLKHHDKLNIFIELEKGKSISLKALMKGINYKYSHQEEFNKIAIVTDSKWFQTAVNVSDVFLNVDTRTFDLEERLDAIQWISI